MLRTGSILRIDESPLGWEPVLGLLVFRSIFQPSPILLHGAWILQAHLAQLTFDWVQPMWDLGRRLKDGRDRNSQGNFSLPSVVLSLSHSPPPSPLFSFSFPLSLPWVVSPAMDVSFYGSSSHQTGLVTFSMTLVPRIPKHVLPLTLQLRLIILLTSSSNMD